MRRRSAVPYCCSRFIRQLLLSVFVWALLFMALPTLSFVSAQESSSDEATSPQKSESLLGTIDDRKVGASTVFFDFDTFGLWRRGDERWGTLTQSDEEVADSEFAARLSYGFPAVPNNYVVFRQRTAIPGRPDGLRLQVLGDGSTHFLNAWVEDANRQVWQFTFGRIEHTGWQSMFAPLDVDAGWPNELVANNQDLSFKYPIRLTALVLDGHSSEQGSQGIVYLDELSAVTFANSAYISDSVPADEQPERPMPVTGALATISVERLNVREGPDVSFGILTKVVEGEQLPIIAEPTDSGWLQVATSDGPGWISADFATVETLLRESSGLTTKTVADAAADSDTSIASTASLTSTELISGTSISSGISTSDASIPDASAEGEDIEEVQKSETETAQVTETASGARSSIPLVKPPDGAAEPTAANNAKEQPSGADSTDNADAAPELLGQIAFPSFAGGQYAIFAIDANGENLRWITGNASQPSFSPDGKRLAFRNWDPDARGIAVIESSGGPVRQISNRPEDGLPAWSPDNDTLAYFSRREGDRRSRIYQASVDNRNEWQLEEIGGEYPTWMPDGRLLYRATRPQIAVTIMDDDGENQVSLISDGDASAPAVSPDGETILFMSKRSGNWEIYLTDIGGSEPIALTDDLANDGLPTWSPDGESIAFVTDRDGFWAIWLMDRDGGNQRELLMIPGELDPRMPDEPDYRFRGWQEERLSWGE